MQCGDAASEIEILDSLQAGILHHRLERLLVRVHAYRLGEIAIAVSIIRDLVAQPGQDFKRVDVLRFLQQRRHLGELQHQQLAAGLEHPAHLDQCSIFVGHVAQAESDRHTIKIIIGER